MPRRPVLRVALLCIGAALVAAAVIGATRGITTSRYEAEKSRASAKVAGIVIEDSIGDADDIRVRWRDPRGHDHVQRFGIYDTDRYVKGATFKIAFDPAHPDARAFPADPDETSAEDDLWVPILLACAGAIGVLIGWAVRGLRFRLALRRPEQHATAQVHCGDLRSPGPISLGLTYWLKIRVAADPELRPRWQQVMWHPALEGSSSHLTGTLHGSMTSRRPVVFAIDDRERLVPIGRFRKRVPKRVLLADPEVARTDLSDTFIVPSGVIVDVRPWWWRRGLVFIAVGAGAGAIFGFFVAGLDDALSFATAAAAGTVNAWGFRGAEP